VSSRAEVRWSVRGEFHVHATDDPTPFVRSLFDQYGDDVADLHIRRATLEDTYLAMLHKQEVAR
jgi:ABC-2 type transport system ATP-binding protein